MQKTSFLNTIIKYKNEERISFCMPGHKQGRGFLKTEIGTNFYQDIIRGDITEIKGMDNLHHPNGIIKQAEELLTKVYKSKKSYFLVNGSTSGNLAMIFSAFNEGDEVIVERNCHKSIYNGLILRKLKPIYIDNNYEKKYNVPLSIDEEQLFKIIDKNKKVKGIILTYPNYYGVCFDLKKVVNECNKRGILVLIDGAHAAHFTATKLLPSCPVKIGADLVVTSCHKTLPAFTQTAFLHINKKSLIQNTNMYLKMFSSTSPSYMLMGSMDYARYYLQELAGKDYEKLYELIEEFKKNIKALDFVDIVDKEVIRKSIYDFDFTRIILNFENQYRVDKIVDYLDQNNLDIEMHDPYNIVLIATPFNTRKDFNELYRLITECAVFYEEMKTQNIIDLKMPEIEFMPYEAIEMKTEQIELKKAVGKVSGKPIIPYPPGVPLLMPGEIIDDKLVEVIIKYIDEGVEVIGVEYENNNKMKKYKINILI